MKRLFLLFIFMTVFLFSGISEVSAYKAYAEEETEQIVLSNGTFIKGDKVYDSDGNFKGYVSNLDYFNHTSSKEKAKAESDAAFKIAVIIFLCAIACTISIRFGHKNVKCPYCKKSIPSNSVICPKCGRSLINGVK